VTQESFTTRVGISAVSGIAFSGTILAKGAGFATIAALD
jgi:hypothetical protein